MRGRHPKPAEIRQNRTKKVGRATIEAPDAPSIPDLVHPAGEAWHPMTIKAWREFFESAMSTQWLPTDITGLEMLAVCYDKFYKTGDIEFMKEIRLQRPHYGLTPLDRSRLQWEVTRGEQAERQRHEPAPKRPTSDPRKVLRMAQPA